MAELCRIALTYRGPVGHRGIHISRETYGKTWTLRLAEGVWTLTDHNGDDLHSFGQLDLHSKVALPGSMAGYPNLYLLGLGPRIYCFEPEAEVVEALRPHLRRSERANAPQLARWHRRVGLMFLGAGVLSLVGGAAALAWALSTGNAPGFLRLHVGAVAIPLGVLGGGFVATGVRYWRQAAEFAALAVAMNDRRHE